ncbi:MAG: ATP-binding protein [Endozoicomonas sp.]
MSDQAQEIKLEIDSQLPHTAMVAMAVRGLCAMTTLSPVEINRLELCLVEIVNNAIEHAYGNESGHSVEVSVGLSKKEVVITVSDQGQRMPEDILSDREEPEMDPDHPETWLCSGRGLHIVNKLMDEVRYKSADGKNSLFMTKKLRH